MDDQAPVLNFTIYREQTGLQQEELVRSWGAISEPTHVYVSITAYLLFVFVFGPLFMAKRRPFELKNTLMVYNMIQIAWNVYIVYLYYELMGTKSFSIWENPCFPISAAQNFRAGAANQLAEGMKVYYINKLADLMDTVFFILRKKNSQITFLHLFHHVTMVVSTYVSVMVIREEMSAVIATLNAVVHILMYSYYFLAALGPHMQPYLRWKKYLTSFQIVQFVVQLTCLSLLLYNKCQINPKFFLMWAANIAAFLVLFVDFYKGSYKTHKKKEYTD